MSMLCGAAVDFERSKSGKDNQHLEDRLFTATVLNITTAFADDLKSADFGPLDVDDLFKASIFKITPQFMAEMKATGFPNLSLEDLVKARIFRIDAEFVRKTRDMGFANENFEGMVKFSILVTRNFSGIKVKGYEPDGRRYSDAAYFKIEGAYIRESRAESQIQRRTVVERKIAFAQIAALITSISWFIYLRVRISRRR